MKTMKLLESLMSEEKFTTKQAADYRMEKENLIESTKTPGGQRRFLKEQLAMYLEKSKHIKAPQNPSQYKQQTQPKNISNINEEISTSHRIIFGSCEKMEELDNNSIHLMVTSPPYFNAPFDYQGFFEDYETYLNLITAFAQESYRVLQHGRIAVVNCDDMLVKGEKYPIVADITKTFLDAGFRYRDKIIWRKPEGYIRISRRSGVLLQHPYPMYFYPDNLQESVLIFQKGKYKYPQPDERSKIDIIEFQKNKWYLTVWDMVNNLPSKNKENNYPAAFPDELPYRIIKLFSNVGEVVLDPFLGSGTTTKVARQLRRNSIGYEIDSSLMEIIKEKIEFYNNFIFTGKDTIEFYDRAEGRIVEST